MSKTDIRIIYILLLIIIISAGILIYKTNKVPKYDEELYTAVYQEYEEIISNENNNNAIKEKEKIIRYMYIQMVEELHIWWQLLYQFLKLNTMPL